MKCQNCGGNKFEKGNIPIDEYACGFLSYRAIPKNIIDGWVAATRAAQGDPKRVHDGHYIFIKSFTCLKCGGLFIPMPKEYHYFFDHTIMKF